MDSDGNKDVETALSMNVYEYDSLMAGNLLRDCFKPLEDGWSGAVKEVSAEEVEEAEVRYLDGEAVANLSFLLEQCAALQRSDLRQSYTLLNLAQILADMAGDLARSEQELSGALLEDYFRNLRAEATLAYLDAPSTAP